MFIEVLEAVDGKQLVEIALNRKPSLIVTDNHMPRLTGVDAVCLVKQTLPEVKVILVTTVTEDVPEFSGEIVSKSDKNFLKVLRQSIANALS